VAARLERDFARLSIPDCLRMGLGTVHCGLAPVTRFGFHFASNGVQVGRPVTDEIRSAAAEEVRQALVAMGNERPALTKHPAECRFCGYRKVKWCEGVE
jgi:hypothetical protein